MRPILIVDDDPDIRLLLRSLLGMEGYEVADAPGGSKAIQMLSDGLRPSIVLLDVQMPEMDGWDTLASIRVHPSGGDLPVIMCTVKARPEDVRHGWQLRCDGYVSKPFHITELLAEIRSVSSRSPIEREARRRTALESLGAP